VPHLGVQRDPDGVGCRSGARAPRPPSAMGVPPPRGRPVPKPWKDRSHRAIRAQARRSPETSAGLARDPHASEGTATDPMTPWTRAWPSSGATGRFPGIRGRAIEGGAGYPVGDPSGGARWGRLPCERSADSLDALPYPRIALPRHASRLQDPERRGFEQPRRVEGSNGGSTWNTGGRSEALAVEDFRTGAPVLPEHGSWSPPALDLATPRLGQAGAGSATRRDPAPPTRRPPDALNSAGALPLEPSARDDDSRHRPRRRPLPARPGNDDGACRRRREV